MPMDQKAPWTMACKNLLFVLKTKIESPRHGRLTEMWAVLAGKYSKAQAKQKSKRLSISKIKTNSDKI